MVCHYYAQGRCRYGTACKFSHDIQDGAPTRTQHNDSAELSTTTTTNRPSNRKPRQRRKGQQIANQDQVQSTASQRPALENSSNASAGPSRGSKNGGVCHTWKVGTCTRGVACRIPYEHVHADDQLEQQEVEARLAAEAHAAKEAAESAKRAAEARAAKEAAENAKRAAEARAAKEAADKAKRAAEARAAKKAADKAKRAAEARAAREAAENAKRAAEARAAEIAREAAQARAAEIAREAAAKTVQSVVLGSIATFGAGIELSHLVTGFECCTLRIANLPPNVQESEINALFTERGLDRGRFHLVNVKPMANGRRFSAEIITDAESGQALSLDSDCLEFRDEILTLEVSGYNSPGSMSVATERDVNILTISWRAPSVRYVAVYPDTVPATEKVQELNRRICSGRRVKVEVNTMPPGHFIPNFQANSIRISCLPSSVTDEEVTTFSGSDSVRRLKGGVSEDIGNTVATLRDSIERISPGTLRSLEPLQPTPNIDGIVLVRARFATWDDAHAVHTRLLNHHSGHISFWYRLPSPTQYSVTISAEQFRAQKALFVSLIDSIKDKSSCMLHIHEQGAIVRMRLSGSKKEAIGALKVRLESLIAGEKVDGWHRSLGSSGNAFMRSIFDNTGALLRADWKRQALKAYGKPKAVEQARELVEEELNRLSSLEYTRILGKESVRFFVKRGIPELKETFGEDNVKFDISTRRVTISGGEEARHALGRLIQGSLSGSHILPELSGEQTCPICYDNVSSPLYLGCGHIYCAACMRHFLTSAVDSDQFPLTCMGDESQCRVPIPIPIIQQFLPPASFNRLLEVAFNTHISRNPQKFKYCKTPDCNQIYRTADANTATAGQCPSCFTKICTSCHEDAHDGMSCDDYKRTGCHAEEERQTEAWLTAQGGRVKKCPSCQALIEKTEGCNHMTCILCQSHICWRCMGIFTADTIYKHMRDEHGTIHDDDPVIDAAPVVQPDWLLYMQQADLLAERRLEEHQANLLAEQLDQRRQNMLAQRRLEQQQIERVRINELRRAELEAARRDEIARRTEAARQARTRMEEARRRAVYEAGLERERTRVQEEQPGWGCTVM